MNVGAMLATGSDTGAGRRVLMIAAAFPPSNSAGVHRTARFARMLPEFGWEPVVVTGTPAPRGSRSEWWDRLDVLRHVKHKTEATSPPAAAAGVVKVSESQPRRRPWLLEHLFSIGRNARDLVLETPDRDISWVRSATRAATLFARAMNVSAIYSSGPPHSMHLLGRELKERLSLPWIADFRDPWARKPWGYKQQNPWGQRVLPYYEKRCVSAADCVILNTERMRDEFREHYHRTPAEHFVAIPNGCDPDMAADIAEQLNARTVRAGAQDSRTVRLCHPGSLYRQRDPRPLIDAIKLLADSGMRVIFEQVGACETGFQLSDYVVEQGLSDLVTIRPQVPHKEALERMAAADLLLLIQPGTALQVPGKLFEMLLFRTPILAVTDAGATADIIQKYGIGKVISGNNASEIAAAIRELVQQRTVIQREGLWDDACTAFDGRGLTRRLATLLDEVTGDNRADGRRSTSPMSQDHSTFQNR